MPRLGIVIKMPIIYFRSGLKTIYYELKHRRFKKHCLEYTVDHWGSMQMLLFKGIVENWNEFTFCASERNPAYLVPTYFSMFGLLNIQKIASPMSGSNNVLWLWFTTIISQEELFKDSHHFVNPENFSYQNDKFQIIDYGTSRARGVLRKYGTTLHESYNPSFTREDWKNNLERKTSN